MQQLIQLLKEKSLELNLFSAGDREKLGEKHIPDALAIDDFWSPENGAHIADLGTGGGLPGLALAHKHPECRFTLIDATQKKVEAVQEVADILGLKNVQTLSGRFEVLAHQAEYREQFDCVVARAVAPIPTLLEYASGFIKPGGCLYAWKGPNYNEELQIAHNAEELVDLHFEEAHAYRLNSGEERALLRFRKGLSLDDRFPRRDGVPKNNPL